MKWRREEFVKTITSREYAIKRINFHAYDWCDPCYIELKKHGRWVCLYPHCHRGCRRSWKYYRDYQYKSKK